jgi:hypothetical protein
MQRIAIRKDDSLLPMGFSSWHETEALLRHGNDDLARAEVERAARLVGENPRYQLPLLRSRAALRNNGKPRGDYRRDSVGEPDSHHSVNFQISGCHTPGWPPMSA